MKCTLIALTVGLCLAADAAKLDALLKQLPEPTSLLSGEQLKHPAFHSKDNGGTLEVLSANPGEPATYRITTTRKQQNDWETGFSWRTPPGIGPERDDVLLFALEARCIDSRPNAKGYVKAVFRRAVQPYNHALNLTCSFGKEWKRINLPLCPDTDMRAEGVLIAIQVGMSKQRIEVRDVRVLNFHHQVKWPRFVKLFHAMTWSSGVRSVGRPLTPALLWDMGAFSRYTPASPTFDPAGTWSATYSIWTCHGNWFLGNRTLGLLKLMRTPAPDGKTFTLRVERVVRLDEGMLARTVATLECRADALATPISWHLSNTFETPEGKSDPLLTTEEAGGLATGVATIHWRTGKRKFQCPGPVTTNWGLFDAVQRMGDRTPTGPFLLLQDLDTPKSGQTLADRGTELMQIGDRNVSLRRYDQVGHGVLPVKYWVDDKGRLVTVVMHSRAYLLETDAEERFTAYSKSQLARYNRLRARREKKQAKGDK